MAQAMTDVVEAVGMYLFTLAEQEGMNEALFATALAECREEHTPMFHMFIGIDPQTFHQVLMRVGPHLERKKMCKEALGPALKLQLAVKYLSHENPSHKKLAAAWPSRYQPSWRRSSKLSLRPTNCRPKMGHLS